MQNSRFEGLPTIGGGGGGGDGRTWIIYIYIYIYVCVCVFVCICFRYGLIVYLLLSSYRVAISYYYSSS